MIVIAALDAALDSVRHRSGHPPPASGCRAQGARGGGPRDPSRRAEEVAQLITFARCATGPGKQAAVEALGSAQITAGSEAYLMEVALGFESDLRMTALASLGRKAAPLERAEPVWQIACDYQLSRPSGRGPAVPRADQGTDPDRSGAARWTTDQVTTTAARILVADGAMDGAEAAATLLDDDFGELTATVPCLARETRTILAMVTGFWDSRPDEGARGTARPSSARSPSALDRPRKR
ncbi:MAG: hypothetical protein R3F30_16485 [Planctomycetota bacterium]